MQVYIRVYMYMKKPRHVYNAADSAIDYQVDLRMYCFQASLPDSRPPPVCFSPPATNTAS